MVAIQLKPEVLKVLKTLNDGSFTVDQITKMYLAEGTEAHETKKSARQFIYRTILRLIKSGEMAKLDGNKGWPKYKLTDKFQLRLSPSVNPPSTSPAHKMQSTPSHQSLTERLNAHKMELLTAIGEVEEYDVICKDMPNLKEDIQSLYDDSRDRCSKILGRVKALESLLSIGAR
jgi:hypothetical protein